MEKNDIIQYIKYYNNLNNFCVDMIQIDMFVKNENIKIVCADLENIINISTETKDIITELKKYIV